MYKAFFPPSLSPNWNISDDDPDNKYIELLGFDGEYLIAISYEPDENETKPYFLNFQQMKGAFLRYDYTTFEIDCWYPDPEAATLAAFALMQKVNLHYPKFLPISHQMYIGLGPVSQLEQIQRYFGGELKVSSVSAKDLVFKKVIYMPGEDDFIATAGKIIKDYVTHFKIAEADFIGGYLCNENSQKLGKLDYQGNILNESIEHQI
ncbi:hypothetical protein SAMN00777080_1017 [Aquiflexum balticum DSM 16537]|uniref:Uncharacterized protein n=1 Tax=Aquiflexum balticum DSM 16537 TaxID=758820 RepID=A0A1W2H0K4_9BACT|nr:hypothetical protein [Aquiflexum balticum]SMD42465.1 hypothetical protein SAMN00777080_1017 [Aquiflexum balticum DSM 16537]